MPESDGSLIEYHPTIRDLPSTERPRERLEHYGAPALSTAELLAIILRTGVGGQNVLVLSNSLLAQHEGLVGLAGARFPILCDLNPIPWEIDPHCPAVRHWDD